MMKQFKLILNVCLLMFCCSTLTIAQPFESVFGKDTTQWNVVYHIPDYFPTLIFKAYGDTLINEQKYVPVYKKYWYSPLELYGFFKEDVNVGKLWFRSLGGQEELLMDLSLSKNDSFYFGHVKSIPYTVDTVYYKLGKKYISFNEAQPSCPILFIEGLGPFNMFYNIHVSFPEYAQIRCKEKDNVLFFMNSDYGTCLDTITGVNNILNESFRIYPNPTNEYINIATNSTECGPLELFNSIGNLVLSKEIIGNEKINIAQLPRGIYVIRCLLNKKQFTTNLIKQ